MKLLFVIVNSIGNKDYLFNIINHVNGDLFPEIIHIPLSAFDWNNNCYKLDKILHIIKSRFNQYPAKYIVVFSNLEICEQIIGKIDDKIILLNEKKKEAYNIEDLLKNID
ncbi:hypothetical protein [Acidianus manzaensis]|uniref:Uncharacterized protein n=1 Tax=Acidianus manzaensis TaxID=282676 RepID=A0A1W6K0I4_9CREN|nr:hypothetical protein [Acidianus manzaensis]ARM75954.1 hypothetical protein B6F84_07880 [Acidianus manzaensis]